MQECKKLLSSRDQLDVDLFEVPSSTAQAPLGIGVRGEHELVAMASERLRKHFRSQGVVFTEEEEAESASDESRPQSFLKSLKVEDPSPRRETARSATESRTAPEPAEGAEEPTPAGSHSGDPGYGGYPALPGSTPVPARKRRADEQSAELLRGVEGKLSREDEFGFARPTQPLSPRELKALQFYRAFRSGVAFFRMGMYEDARRRLLEALRLQPSNPEAHHYMGLACDHLGELELAEKHLKKAISCDPETGATHFYLGNLYQKQGEFERAVREYKQAIDHDPDIPIVFNNLAWVLYQVGDYEHSIRAFEEAIAMDAELPFPHNGLACVYQETGALPEAIEEFRKAIEIFPEYAAAHLKLGWCLLQTGDVTAAIEEFKAVLSTSDDPEYTVSAQYSLGHSYLAEGLLVEARSAFEDVVEAGDPEFLDALFHLGVIQLRLEYHDEAIKLFQRYLRRAGDQASVDVHKYLAQAHLHEGRFRAAQNACHRALASNARDAEVYEVLGRIAGFQGKWDLAEQHLLHAISLSDGLAAAWYHLGWCYENSQDTHRAIDAYKNAIQRNPEASDAYNNLGWLYLEQGKRDEAMVVFERALELSPSDTGLLNNMGWLYSNQGRSEEALVYYHRALDIEPESSMLHCNIGTLYYHMERFEDARRELQTALDLDQDKQASANARYFLGLMEQADGHTARAIAHFQAGLDFDDELSAAWFRLGECWLAEGDRGAARRALDRYLELEPSGDLAQLARQYLSERLPPPDPPTSRAASGRKVRGRREAGDSSGTSRSRRRERAPASVRPSTR